MVLPVTPDVRPGEVGFGTLAPPSAPKGWLANSSLIGRQGIEMDGPCASGQCPVVDPYKYIGPCYMNDGIACSGPPNPVPRQPCGGNIQMAVNSRDPDRELNWQGHRAAGSEGHCLIRGGERGPLCGPAAYIPDPSSCYWPGSSSSGWTWQGRPEASHALRAGFPGDYWKQFSPKDACDNEGCAM